MKRIVLFLFIAVLALCFTVPAFCRGMISDLDAYKTYIWKTKAEVLNIQPDAIELGNNVWIADIKLIDENTYVLLSLTFSGDKVSSVSTAFSKDCLAYLRSEESLSGALPIGTAIMGLDLKNKDAKISEGEDGNPYVIFPNNILCVTMMDEIEGNELFSVSCQPEKYIDFAPGQ